ncbi:MAG: hypothetical protein QOJ65_16 [Fimbriimonadaceae bacterium]|nr:hypothetical protein [Fimbriimonadaceae bacterium]
MQQYERTVNGAWILVLGILSWVACSCIAGVPAWTLGNSALDDIDKGLADPSQRGLADAGRMLGMANTVFTLVAAIWYVLTKT